MQHSPPGISRSSLSGKSGDLSNSAGGRGRGKLGRCASTSTLNSGASFHSMTQKFRKSKNSLGSTSFGMLDRQGSSNSDHASPTITDLFLSSRTNTQPMARDARQDEERERAKQEEQRARAKAQAEGSKTLLPLPPALVAILASQTKQRLDQLKKWTPGGELVDAEQAGMECKLQDYFKAFATFPQAWTELEECRDRMNAFMDAFSVSKGLLHHCGERLKCTAYVVICPHKVGLRSEPSTLSSLIIPGQALHPGQMVVVDSVVVYNNVHFMKMQGGGWAFERKGSTWCMSYLMCVECGLWWYRVVSEEYAEVRRTPCFDDRVRTGHILVPGEVCVVAVRCVIDERCWLHLADGRGWIFENRPADDEDELGSQEAVMVECKQDLEKESKDLADQEDLQQASAVEVGLWEYECVGPTLAIGATTGGWLLSPGEKVLVDLRVPANGQKAKETSVAEIKATVFNRIWFRLNDGRGWVPKTDSAGEALLRFVRVAPGTHGGGQKNTGPDPSCSESESWMRGIA